MLKRSVPKFLLVVSSALLCWTESNAHSSNPAGTVKVAAVQVAGTDASKVDPSCGKKDVNCAIAALIRRAGKAGASLVVTPEYGLHQKYLERSPEVGDVPSDPLKAPLLTRFSALARELELYLVLQLETARNKKLYNSQVAFDRTGKVVAVHHKFELFAAERKTHTPGTDVTYFDTPFGRVGLLVCADMYGDPRLHDELTREEGADIIAVSTKWTVPRATRWQAAFARDWGVYVVAANASTGAGRGGGVFDPRGEALAIDESQQATLTLAAIPSGR